MIERLFVANKPTTVSSNHFLSRLKRKYGVKKAGYSGTLDPFASGVLIVAFGNYTRLFNYLAKSPKVYETTIWLGAFCESLDNENITKVDVLKPFSMQSLEIVRSDLLGNIKYIPPKFSAKKIDGKRAYELARKDEEFELKPCEMQIFSCEILNYSHPFLTLRLSVSEGSYIRSYAQIFAKKLGVNATLSALKRVSEGKFVYENEKELDPTKFLSLKTNSYLGNPKNIEYGKKLDISELVIKTDGIYMIKFDEFFSIIEIKNELVSYCLNKVKNADIN
ncbi:tRNA pseudouridine synthase B [Campylobacter hyointestinalis]|nr:tRNA pseudouridine 55 synthase [Campylobacter hyointestinalis subsp. hyointestinalis LMG 9260]CUU69379.1 tRNA pseudouridine synthase B [Campylobacter hyointestinalis]SUW88888.1 tRNA pseudouridine synthase B [Campylobacter hyointestinalis]